MLCAKNARLCADPVMTNKPCLLDIFVSFTDGITKSKYMYISYIVLHSSCRYSGAKNVRLCADPVMTNKKCLFDIFRVNDRTNSRYISTLFYTAPADALVPKTSEYVRT